MNYEKPLPRCNWGLIIGQLGQCGISSYQLARDLNLNASTIQRWKRGDSEPPHSAGEFLLWLHYNKMNEVKQ